VQLYLYLLNKIIDIVKNTFIDLDQQFKTLLMKLKCGIIWLRRHCTLIVTPVSGA